MMFVESHILMLLWAVPFLGIVLLLEVRTIRRRLSTFASARMEELLNVVWKSHRTVLKAGAFILVLTLLVLTLARPRWGFEWKEVPKGGIDIMIALDLSSSMLATDISPNRLERAKREIIDLLDILEGDRIGIIAFAGVSFVHSPLTVDYRLASLFIQQLDSDLIPVQGTALGEAINRAVNSLEKASAQDNQGKAIILITDGEDQKTEPLKAAQLAAEKGIKIYAIGIGGTDGAPIPLPGGGFKKDRSGNLIVSKLDEKILQEITQTTNGMYVRSTTGDLDLETIYKKGIRSSIEAGETGSFRQKVWFERYSIFLAIALLLIILEFLVRDFVPKNKQKNLAKLSVLLLTVLLGGATDLFANNVGDAEKAFEHKDYKTASDKFLKAEIEEPDNLQHSYNRAVSQFHNGQYQEAAQGFSKAAQSPDKTLAAPATFNLGNTLVAQGQLAEAAKAYEDTLKINPQDKAAIENLQWVQKQLKKQEQQEQEKKEENKKEKKDDQKQDKAQEQDKTQEEQNQQQSQESEEKQRQEQGKEKPSDTQEGGEQKHEEQKEKAGELKEMSQEQAEKLLRSIQDQEEVYGLPPHIARPEQPPEKDW
ncbi:MAG: VWA domain-containing protein [Deltaproteobacteria bacterium]|nr:VWA domain-containing protein [Deltaproteobacteria bacterium]